LIPNLSNVSAEAVALLGRTGEEIWIPVVGDSMRPLFDDGDRVAIRPGAFRPRLGDLAIFRQADYVVLHRVLGPVRGAGKDGPYRARGDGRSRLDPPVAVGAILARAVAVETRRGRFRLDTPGARLYAVAVGLHALAWGGLAAALRPLGAEDAVARFDRALLAAAHALLFRLLHRRLSQGRPEPAC
jgi:hypothetical protein